MDEAAKRTDRAREGITKVWGDVGRFARETSSRVLEHADDLRDATVARVEDLTSEKEDPYEEAVARYNAAFTAMNDDGLSLLRVRERSTDLIELVELLVNSIANTPKSFDKDFEEISVQRARFLEAEDFARQDLESARRSAARTGVGLTAGAAVASLAPSAAMWVATTFGAASTGTAISTLSGAAATNAALAWLGGGAVAAGGGGTVAGGALLALAGPVGWTIAGATLLTSIALFAKKRADSREEKQEALLAVTTNTATIEALGVRVADLLQRTGAVRELLVKSYSRAVPSFGADFLDLAEQDRSQLAALVNTTKACAALLGTRVAPDDEHA